MNKKLLFSTAISLTFASAGVLAQSFSDLDSDKDGRISRTEAEADSSLLFSQLDKDGDGFLSTSEMPAVGGPGGGAVSGSFETLDKNHDGYLSRDEASSDNTLVSRFSELDKDRDGYVSRPEYPGMGGGPTGGAMSGDKVSPDASTNMNLEPPSDVQGRGEAYSNVESRYGSFPDVKGIY